eukprot:jgi/Mesvir1/21979/Mv04515-RA.1
MNPNPSPMEKASEPVVNINVLVDSKKEYVDQLERGLTEPIFQSFKNILTDAEEVSESAGMDTMSAFLQLVTEIPDWGQDVIEEETEEVMEAIPYFRDLLKAYFVCTSMIMGSIRMSRDPNQTMKVRVPSPTRFIHLVMKNVGSDILDDSEFFVGETNDGELKLHRRNLFATIREAVRNAVHTLMPIDDILKEYMGDMLDKDTFKGGEEVDRDDKLEEDMEDLDEEDDEFEDGHDMGQAEEEKGGMRKVTVDGKNLERRRQTRFTGPDEADDGDDGF